MSALKIVFSNSVRNLPKVCLRLDFGQTLVVLDGRKVQGSSEQELNGIYQRSPEQFAVFLQQCDQEALRFAIRKTVDPYRAWHARQVSVLQSVADVLKDMKPAGDIDFVRIYTDCDASKQKVYFAASCHPSFIG